MFYRLGTLAENGLNNRKVHASVNQLSILLTIWVLFLKVIWTLTSIKNVFFGANFSLGKSLSEKSDKTLKIFFHFSQMKHLPVELAC